MGISCVIPLYNEEERVEAVLAVMSKVSYIDEIICINDGSTDKTLEIISNYNVKVINNSENLGKSESISIGIDFAKEEYVFLLDGDLRFLKEKEITAILKLTLIRRPDMVVLRRSTMPWISKKFRADYLITGQRIVKKSDLLEVLKEEPKAYQIEFAMNHYMMKNKKNVRWSFFYAIHTYKMQKNFLFGTINEVKMYAIIFFYNFGFIKYNLLKQLFFFRPKKLV